MIKELLVDATNLTKKNYMLFIPTIAASLVVGIIGAIVGAVGAARATDYARITAEAAEAGTWAPESLVPAVGVAFGATAILGVVGAIITLLGHGMTIAMAGEVVETGSTSLKTGWQKTKPRIVSLVIGSIVVGALVGIGFVFLILPGLVIAFLLMFTFVVMMTENLGVAPSIQKSIKTALRRPLDTIVFALAVIAIGFIAAIVNVILGLIPLLGALLVLIVNGVYAGFVSVMIVYIYRRLSEPTAEA